MSDHPTWQESITLLSDLAMLDLEHGTDPQPTLVAFRDDEGLFLATIRPFDKGQHASAIIELGALARSLGANRLAISLTGRAWSAADPIPPVCSEGDLRQRALIVHVADAVENQHKTTITPFAPAGESITAESGQGWVPETLKVIAENPDPVARPAVWSQIIRCEDLGHQIALSPAECCKLD